MSNNDETGAGWGGMNPDNLLDDVKAKIQSEAKKGAEQAIPKIKEEVRKEAKKIIEPMVKSAFMIGGVALALSLLALFKRR